MDKIENYRRIIQRILTERASVPYSYGEISSKTIFDSENDSYILLTVGWNGIRRVHGVLVHLEIIGGKIWIQRDGTEDGVAYDLEKAGIPKNDIVLGFHPPDVRPFTEYATV